MTPIRANNTNLLLLLIMNNAIHLYLTLSMLEHKLESFTRNIYISIFKLVVIYLILILFYFF